MFTSMLDPHRFIDSPDRVSSRYHALLHTNNEIAWKKCEPAFDQSRTLEDCPVWYDRNVAECCASIREAFILTDFIL